MQHETTIGLYRATKKNGQISKLNRGFCLKRKINLLKEGRQIHINRAIDDNPKSALIVMLCDVNQRFGKTRILRSRHSNEEMVREIDIIHELTILPPTQT